MDRAFESGAVALAPTAPVTPSIGYPTGGNPVGGIPPTKPGDYWFHMITEELRAIVAAGGLTPDRLVLNQVLQALPAALASRPELSRSLLSNGRALMLGGTLLQWGLTGSIASSSTPTPITFPIAFPTAVRYINFIGRGTATPGSNTNPTIASDSATGFSFINAYLSAHTFFWFAIGH